MPKPVLLSLRLHDSEEKDMIKDKASSLNMTVSDFLRACILHAIKSGIQPRKIPEIPEESVPQPKFNELRGKHDELLGHVMFMFTFFQKNAANLDITEEERNQLGKILAAVKEAKKNGP